MKRLIRSVQASTDMINDISPECVLSLLKEIDELKGKTIKLSESETGNIQFIIGDTLYTMTE